MAVHETILSKQEKNWILERRITRLSDNKEVQIYPMGAERYLSSTLFENNKGRYNIRADIEGKNVLVIPGYGTSSFLFAQAGAKSITVYDKDPVTIAWMKAFKKYYHYKEHTGKGEPYPSIEELFTALTCWYPPLMTLPSGKYRNILFWAINPNLLRRAYIHYMVYLVRHAIELKIEDNFELDKNIQFNAGTIDKIGSKEKPVFDTAFVPYLLGVRNGIEKEKEIVGFIEQLLQYVPTGHILVNPSRNTKEFYITGKRYFVTIDYENIQDIPELKPYFFEEDKDWFRTQGLVAFRRPILKESISD
ncbi:ABC transporter permease [Legionella feeleii]|uniref:ABC transporter permease n=1 Tax=Legionella feeleii TaxID=453 RepID=A0A378IT65_9GAMM|nr:ABC transporter permease [Legionella feeleii]STX38428.1 ABC transporter permease [Legionella feeleii]